MEAPVDPADQDAAQEGRGEEPPAEREGPPAEFGRLLVSETLPPPPPVPLRNLRRAGLRALGVSLPLLFAGFLVGMPPWAVIPVGLVGLALIPAALLELALERSPTTPRLVAATLASLLLTWLGLCAAWAQPAYTETVLAGGNFQEALAAAIDHVEDEQALPFVYVALSAAAALVLRVLSISPFEWINPRSHLGHYTVAGLCVVFPVWAVLAGLLLVYAQADKIEHGLMRRGRRQR